MTHGRPFRFFITAVVAIAVTGCGQTTTPPPTSSASPPMSAEPSQTASATKATPSPTSPTAATPDPSAQAALYEQIEVAVQQLRGLQARTPLEPTILDAAGVRDYMTKAFDAQAKPEVLSAQERLYKALAMLPASASLRQLELDLQSSQVIGFYDDQTRRLYVVSESGSVGPVQKVTFAHEFTHALQDQNFGLSKLQIDAPDQSDRDEGRLSLVEGDATLSMSQWMTKYLTLPEMLQVVQDSGAGAQQAQLDAAPAILRESLTFPYVQGLAFVQHLYTQGGWAAVNAAYSKPPASTSQIIHPELYDRGVAPVAVTLPPLPASLGSGWQKSLDDTFGEFQLAVWLKGAASSTAAGGWAGDRIALYEGPGKAWAVVLHTAWQSPAAANGFAAAVASAPRASGSVARVCPGATAVGVVIASQQSILDALGGSCTV